ncbi:MAG TPA: 16S rRNA (guanine(966)-N(2))-methyltransferase RsmD [Anaerolineales bacterium]|nr:16S rRNA (guanine(966)-N(2))-methyltransferase RsmD [Anaerolineales bacterium]
MSSLRVIAGKARGRKLRSVPGDLTRPITDRTKSALFNIIGADIINSTFLDLFAGTGSVGIEALSRGASFARFLEIQRRAIKTIKANLAETGLGENAEVVFQDAIQLFQNQPDRLFDYIYVAPPQYKGIWEQAVITMDKNIEWLSSDGWVIVQIHPKEYKEIALMNLEKFDERRYGSTLLVFFRRP